MQSLTVSMEQSVQDAIRGLDLERIRRTYWGQNEFIVLERFLPPEVVDQVLADVEQVRPEVNRNYVPVHKKGGSVSFYSLLHKAPAILSLYRSPTLLAFLSRLVNARLLLCPEDDPHSCALYFYMEPGDHIGWHFDNSYYKGARYTVLLGLVERSERCRLVATLHKGDPARETPELTLPMNPGSLVIFNGDKLWHAVTPLEEGAERIILTLQYVTNREMGPFKRLFSNMKDAFAYFGPAALFRWNPSNKNSQERIPRSE